jgi:hypothetical protein
VRAASYRRPGARQQAGDGRLDRVGLPDDHAVDLGAHARGDIGDARVEDSRARNIAGGRGV